MFGCLVALLGLILLAQPIAGQQLSSVPGVAPVPPVADVAAAAAAAQQRAPQSRTRQTGTSRIRGSVITGDSGQPARQTSVRLSGQGLLRAALTDADGLYEFANLPAGRYTVSAFRTAYITTTRTVELADRAAADQIDLRLARGGVIAGRIVDEFGDPIAGAIVTPLRSQFVQGRRRLIALGRRATTNDIGEYRLFGLDPGQYYVSATAAPGANSANGPNVTVGTFAASGGGLIGVTGGVINGVPFGLSGGVPDSQAGYAPTYYPGTPDATAAARVPVAASQTVSDISLVLVPAKLARISGVALDGDGRPIAGGGVTAAPRGDAIGLTGHAGQVRADGTFTIPNVPPGEYVVRATARPTGPPARGRQGTPPLVVVGEVTVNGEDVADVQLAPPPQVLVTGRVVFRDALASASLKGSFVRVLSQPVDPNDTTPMLRAAAAVNDDFTFEMPTTAGAVTLRAVVGQNVAVAAASGPAPSGWVVSAVRVGGRDVTDSGLDLGSAEDVAGVEIELTNRMPLVTGVVTDSKGKPVADSYVLLFADDPDRWVAASGRYIATARAGQDGRFNVGTLPPGDYYAAAFDAPNTGEWQDPDFLEDARHDAVRFTLGDGETHAVNVTLSSSN